MLLVIGFSAQQSFLYHREDAKQVYWLGVYKYLSENHVSNLVERYIFVLFWGFFYLSITTVLSNDLKPKLAFT